MCCHVLWARHKLNFYRSCSSMLSKNNNKFESQLENVKLFIKGSIYSDWIVPKKVVKTHNWMGTCHKKLAHLFAVIFNANVSKITPILLKTKPIIWLFPLCLLNSLLATNQTPHIDNVSVHLFQFVLNFHWLSEVSLEFCVWLKWKEKHAMNIITFTGQCQQRTWLQV